MFNLEEVSTGKTCTIRWLLGEVGKYLQDKMHLELDDHLNVIYNDGESIIIKHDNKTYALNYESAHAIKVVC